MFTWVNLMICVMISILMNKSVINMKKETSSFTRFPFLLRKMGLEVLLILKILIERGFPTHHLRSVTRV